MMYKVNQAPSCRHDLVGEYASSCRSETCFLKSDFCREKEDMVNAVIRRQKRSLCYTLWKSSPPSFVCIEMAYLVDEKTRSVVYVHGRGNATIVQINLEETKAIRPLHLHVEQRVDSQRGEVEILLPAQHAPRGASCS